MDAFNERRGALSFSDLPLLPSIGRMDVSFFDNCLWGIRRGIAREGAIYGALFPTSPYEWAAYADLRRRQRRGLSIAGVSSLA